MMSKKMTAVLLAALCLLPLGAQNPTRTCLFAHRDTCDLYLDVYDPSPGSETVLEGKDKPTIMFVFGGGFITGERSSKGYLPWFKLLNDNGYRVVTIDYRLGLKGVKMAFSPFALVRSAKATKHAVDIGVEDAYAAVAFLSEHSAEFGIDPSNIVISGSSAGAMISLSAEYELCNSTSRAAVLGKGFDFAGVMAFAGAIMSDSGKPSYDREPCPQMLIHGTADKTVNYKKLHMFNWGIFGPDVLAKIFKKNGYTACIYRFKDHNHDMASNFIATWPEQKRFLEQNVIKGVKRSVDAMVDDPAVPSYKNAATLKSLY